MTTNHIDQLTEWWENAEREGVVSEGDTIIKKGRAGYDIYSAWAHEAGEYVENWKHEHSDSTTDYRILARAPKPKPAWHDAVAVIASNVNTERQVWERYMGSWCGTAGDEVDAEDLTDVVPLIEAKVTDEMVKRAIDKAEAFSYIERAFGEIDSIDQNAMAVIIAAALGLETE